MLATVATTMCLAVATVAVSAVSAQAHTRWSVASVPVVEIGVMDGDPAYVFDAIVAAHFLDDGRMVAADAGFLDIRIFGRDGRLQTRFGGQGRGPGEFEYIGGMWITAGGSIAVWDPANRRISTFTSGGELQSTASVGSIPGGGNLEVHFGSFADDDVVLAALRSGVRSARPVADPWAVGRFGLDGEFRESLGSVRGMRRVNGYPIPFTPMPLVAVLHDSMFVADGHEGVIRVLGAEGKPARLIHPVETAGAASPAVWSALESELHVRGEQLYLDYLQQGGVPREGPIPSIGGIVVDDRDLLWIKRYDPAFDSIWLRRHPMWMPPGGDWRIVRPDGAPVASLRLPADVRIMEIADDRILGVTVDENDVERLVVLKLTRG